ncbi:MAG: carboxypeptidase-like regulatory domain-containing protein [Saprospiraceae bacterium]|nr:carboxypeptidase-like regulatory domain-containing protein [Saprospiraceae bacterium]
MKKFFTRSLFLAFLMLPFLLLAQRQVTIYGTLLSAKDNSPVIYAHIYIPNTTYGVYSDDQGNFSLEARVWASFELVISHIEHEITILQVNDNQDNIQIGTTRLRPKAYDLKEVVVTDDKDWKKNYELFERNFIGTTPQANQCKILNKLVLNFNYDKKTSKLTAWAYEPLKIENRDLGYRIRYDLVLFEFDDQRGNLIYKGFPAFELIRDASKRQQRRWEKNRKEAYQGSVMHFIRSLYHNTLKEEGFELSEIVKKTEQSGNVFMMRMTEDPIHRDAVITQEDSAEFLRFQADSRIQVRYTGEPESTAYFEQHQHIMRSNVQRAKFQTSGITLDANFVRIYSDGQVHDGVDMLIDGYFAWEKIAKMLPYDYIMK